MKELLICLYWEETPDDKMIRHGEVSAHIGNCSPPTSEEMNTLLYLVKMEFAKLRRKQGGRLRIKK